MILLLEFLQGLPWVCFVIGAFSTIGLGITASGYCIYLFNPAEEYSLKPCDKWVVFFVTLLTLCICIGFCAPRAELVAMQLTNEQVTHGKMTPEQQTEFLSKYKSKREQVQ